MAATHSYSAVPSIFIVAPSGRVKLDILLETPLLYSTASMVNGNVALDEAVENALTDCQVGQQIHPDAETGERGDDEATEQNSPGDAATGIEVR